MLVTVLLSTTFACGLIIAGLHVINRLFIAPRYDVVLNLLAFSAATASNALLGQLLPAILSACAVAAWIWLGLRTYRAVHNGLIAGGQSNFH
ncbi:hypothetical protein [Corynebacterium pyruviciproducens]|uniref:hypothetical protein n=1 Tax=Corynebacterium pyruviciproducens TaxID=598660 RepID=UPI00288C63A3|nr:hypothetical protein [Corynebacterium pyruviciproducens]